MPLRPPNLLPVRALRRLRMMLSSRQISGAQMSGRQDGCGKEVDHRKAGKGTRLALTKTKVKE